jgi:2-phospho-L-lactate guanylyltransferase (CobY/MobA/RfbA family)
MGLGVRELEQGGEGLEPVGQSCVARRTHLDSVFNVASIVIPFRGEDAKQRLPEQVRAELARAMLADVTAAAEEVGRTFVADRRGQGAAVEAALSEVQETPVLVVNADLPAVTPRDLLALLGSIPPNGIAVAAAADGTTNALGLAAPGLFEPVYGPGSAERFLALAPSRLVEIPNLADDVDELSDLERLEGRLGAKTRAALESLRFAAR